MNSTLRVIALGEALVPYFDQAGRLERGRYIGRDFNGKPAAEEVRDTTYVQRALARGELALAPTVEPAVAPPAPPPRVARPAAAPAVEPAPEQADAPATVADEPPAPSDEQAPPEASADESTDTPTQDR